MPRASHVVAPGIVTPQWRMPIAPEDYPDQSPLLTKEETRLMKQYIALSPGTRSCQQARIILARLSRFERPYWDTVALHANPQERLAPGRRVLFRYMVQTGKAFWAWSKETWVEVIQMVPCGRQEYNRSSRFWMINLAYLFSDFLYVDVSVRFAMLAQVVFGKGVLEAEVEKLCVPLFALGYSDHPSEKEHYRWLCSLAMLINRCPYIEAFSAQVIETTHRLLANLPGAMAFRGRQDLLRIQTALCTLNILDEPVILAQAKKGPSDYTDLWKQDSTIAPQWLAWVCAYYEQTPQGTDEANRKQCYILLTVGRWLKRTHPEVTEPSQWTEVLAAEYVTYCCSAFRGDSMLPSNRRYASLQKAPQQFSPHTIINHLLTLRKFFSTLQKRSYVINGRPSPKLQLAWLPDEAFKIPFNIQAAAKPNPKDIQEDAWFKLIWAACTLTKDQLLAAGRVYYPLAYYRAICLIWVTAARRSDEIRRLSVGCVRREWAPEMCDEQSHQVEPEEELCYLRVPTNKYTGEFYVPIPTYVADAIEVWEQVRPAQQKVLVDRKTHNPTHYLFQSRNQLMSKGFLNKYAIPLLCKLAGVSRTDVVGPITSHRARATTATWMYKMGMTPADIGKLLGHTNPLQSLPWYLREDKHRLGRAYRKANPLERYVTAILDTNAQANQEPCVFYYLADGPDGRPRMCGNPHFSRCIHQLMCAECEAYIDHELAESIEKREGAVVITVPIPLPPQVVAELNEQDETGSEDAPEIKALPPPLLPSPAFHFNKKVPMRVAPSPTEDLHTRLADIEAQIAKKQGKADRRSATMRALLQEYTEVKALLEAQEKDLSSSSKQSEGLQADEMPVGTARNEEKTEQGSGS